MRAKGTFSQGRLCALKLRDRKDCKAQLLCSDVMHAAAVGGQFG
jgi:hypothetical protein